MQFPVLLLLFSLVFFPSEAHQATLRHGAPATLVLPSKMEASRRLHGNEYYSADNMNPYRRRKRFESPIEKPSIDSPGTAVRPSVGGVVPRVHQRTPSLTAPAEYSSRVTFPGLVHVLNSPFLTKPFVNELRCGKKKRN
jgi:hypothetical protein